MFCFKALASDNFCLFDTCDQTRKDDATYICVVFCNFESAAWRVAQAASMFSQGEHAGFRKKQKMVFKVLKIGIVFRSVIIGGDLGGMS
jgi:hypothetical protein